MKKMSKGMLMTALICGAVYLGGSPVYASELQEFSLDEYVVTAARTETKLVDTPANISVVDAQTIEERHYQDVSEVLKDVPGANVIDNGSGALEKAIVLNGDTRVLVLVDGRRMDFASGTSSGRAGFDLNLLPDVNLIERIEVLKGAGGALYGSDAVGGVVNIITKKADKNYGKVSLGFGSHDARDMSAMYAIKEGKTSVTLSAAKNKQGYYEYKDAKTGNNKKWPHNSGYNNDKVSLKVAQNINDKLDFEVGYDYSKFDGFTVSSLTNKKYTTGEYRLSNNDIENQNVYAKINWLNDNGDVGYLQYHHSKLDYFSIDAIDGELYSNKVETTNAVDLQQTFSTSEKNKLVVGASWSDTDVDNGSIYNEGVDTLAFFVNDTWEFAPTWNLNAGVRYDNHSVAGNETTFSAGLNKKFNDFSHAYINWGQVYNVPTTGDLYDNTMGGANPNLKAEKGDTWNIGYNTQINSKTDIGINYFESNLEDAITWSNPGGGSTWVVDNVAKQKKRGMELSVSHKLNNNVQLTASYTYIRVKNNEDGTEYVRDTGYVPNMYRMGIKYQDGKWNADAYLRYGNGCNTSTSLDLYSNIKGDYTESNYFTFDLAVTYRATKDLSFYAKGYNLFNEAYAEHAGVTNGSYDTPAQSRRFIVGAEYKF